MSTNARAIDARTQRIRLVAPDPDGAITLLGKTYSGTWLPTSSIPQSPDLVEGSYTRRLNDAGEFSLTFPNTTASDEVPWRTRFDPDGKLEFVEIYRELDLEFVGVVERVELDRGSVTVSGVEPFALLKSAFERDRVWTAAPRDVVNRYCRVPLLVAGDDFDDGSIDPAWAITRAGTGNMTWTEADGYLKFSGTVVEQVDVRRTVGAAGTEWRAQAVIAKQPATAVPAWEYFLMLEDGGGSNMLALSLLGETREAQFWTQTASVSIVPNGIPVELEAPVTLTIECQDRWIRAYVNGQLIGFLPSLFEVDRIRFSHYLDGTGTRELWLDQLTFVRQEPFLQSDATSGSSRLPGDYPPGGLRGRYWNDHDLAGLSAPLYYNRVFAPDREPYGERLDPVIDTSGGLVIPLTPGPVTSDDNFSVRWFGAVYLDPGNGTSVTFETTGVDDGVRLWVGDTKFKFGAVGLDAGISSWGPAAGTQTATYFYGLLDPESRAGWYPIIVEFMELSGSASIRLQFTPGGSGTYVDPGGTTITRGTKRVIPSSSLSPLGCFDGRVQGQSHFDLIQQATREYGLEILPVLGSLESADFPSRIVPADRYGRDTDVQLVVEEDEHGAPILNPGATYDATEQAAHLLGSAQGLNFGRGDVTAEIADLDVARRSLFMLQRWMDAGDVGFADLLAARLRAELALFRDPWQEIRGNPLAHETLADSWPLSDVLERFRWMPGDAVRVFVPDVGIEDVEPRRITQLTRSFGAHGRTGAQVGFRNRPRGRAVELRRIAQATMKPLRSKTAQLVVIPSEYGGPTVVAAGGFSDFARLSLASSDRVVRAYLRVIVNTGTQALTVEVNGVSLASALGATSQVPVEIDLTAYARQAGDHDDRMYVRLFNAGAGATTVEYQAFAEVTR